MKFNLDFDPAYGQAIEVAPAIARLTAPNASPFTFYGTNTYIVGDKSLAVIDPGPDNDAHFEAIVRAIAGRSVSHILVSHTHRDHSPLAGRLKALTGAPTVAEGPHRAARTLREGEVNALDASADRDFMPDIVVQDGDIIEGDGWALETVLSPGHAANHAAFADPKTGILFSADHVMAWATTIVAPPDGSMADYTASLDKLLARDDQLYLPGHGGPLTNPLPFVRALKSHRKMRELAVMERIRVGDETIEQIVQAIYRDTDPRLFGAAGLSVLAHLEDLVDRAQVSAPDGLTIRGRYFVR